MSTNPSFIVLHFFNNEPLVFNNFNVHFMEGEPDLRILSKIRFVLQHNLMNDVVFAFDAAGTQDCMYHQYAIAAAYFHEKEKLFPLSMKEEKMKADFIRLSTPHYLQGLLV